MGDCGTIYTIRCDISGRRYVGSSCNFKARKSQHLHQLRHGRHHSKFMQREFDKHGESNFSFDVIESGIKPELLIDRETAVIIELSPEYNGAQPGATRRGSKQSDECKRKVSAANNGRKHTKEAIAAITASLIGNRRAIGNANRLKVTAEVKSSISEMRERGMGYYRIAKALSLSKKTIINTVRGRHIERN